MKWKRSHCTPNRAEPNRTGPSLTERVYLLIFVNHHALIKYRSATLFFLGKQVSYASIDTRISE